LYDVQKKQKTGEINDSTLRGLPVLSPNGLLVACSDCYGEIHLYDAETGRRTRTLRSSSALVKRERISYHCEFLFSPDGEKLIETSHMIDHSESGSGMPVRMPFEVFEISSGRHLASFFSDVPGRRSATPVSYMACSPDGRLLAVAERASGVVRLVEIASGKVRGEFAGHRHGVHGLDFSPDGKTLASGGEDNVVFLWDVAGTQTSGAKPERDIDPASLWNDLASDDAKRAGNAIASLQRTPDRSVALFQKKLRPAEDVDEKPLAQWIVDLDADEYATRETASRELFRFGEYAEAAMRRALRNRPSLEVRKRIEILLDQLESGKLPPETLQVLRAIEALEHIGTPAARRCLESLAKGAAEARPTRDAQASLRRMNSLDAKDAEKTRR
jgi:hypothetical protein